MDELLNVNLEHLTSSIYFQTNDNMKKVIAEYREKYPDKKPTKVNYILMDLLINSDDLALKGNIAYYFHQYIHGTLRGDTGEAHYNELQNLYDKVTAQTGCDHLSGQQQS